VAVTDLTAEAAAGGMFFAETGAVTVTGVSVSVNRVASNASTAPVGVAQSDLVTGNNGNIVLVASGAVTITDGANANGNGVTANGSGNVLLQSTGNAVALQSSVVSGTGDVTLLAQTGVSQSAAGTLSTGGVGTLDVQATTGNIVMAPGAVTMTGNGDVRYQALAGSVTLGEINAGRGSVEVLASGSILDNPGSATPDIITSGLYLQAGIGIGSANQLLNIDADTVAMKTGSGGGYVSFGTSFSTGPVIVAVDRVQSDATTLLQSGRWFGLQASGGGTLWLTSVGSITLATDPLFPTEPVVELTGGGKLHMVAGTNFIQEGNVETDGGSVELEALIGTFLMTGETQTTTDGGDIAYRAHGNLSLSVLDARGPSGSAGNIQILSTSDATLYDTNFDHAINLFGNALTLEGRGPVSGPDLPYFAYADNAALKSQINNLSLISSDPRATGWVRQSDQFAATLGYLEERGIPYLEVINTHNMGWLLNPAPVATADGASVLAQQRVSGYMSVDNWVRTVNLVFEETYVLANPTALENLDPAAHPDVFFAEMQANASVADTVVSMGSDWTSVSFGIDATHQEAPLLDLELSDNMVNVVGLGGGRQDWLRHDNDNEVRSFEFWIEELAL